MISAASHHCPYQQFTITKKMHPVYITWYGTVQAKPLGKLYAPESGIITQMYIETGQLVHKKQKIAAIKLDDTHHKTIYSEFDGLIKHTLTTKGERVIANQTALYEVIDPNDLNIMVEIPQKSLKMVQQHQRGSLLDTNNLEYSYFNHSNITIYPYINPKTATFRVKIQPNKPIPHLLPGMMIATQFLTTIKPQVSIPDNAIVKQGEITGVYTISDTCKPLFRLVRLGRSIGNTIEVISGLKTNERILINPEQLETEQRPTEASYD